MFCFLPTGGGGGALDFSSKHSSGMGSPSASPLSQVPIHPDVCFKRLPFYDMLGELLKPSSLGESLGKLWSKSGVLLNPSSPGHWGNYGQYQVQCSNH